MHVAMRRCCIPARIIAGNENGGRFSRNCTISSSKACFGASKVIVDDRTAMLQRENTHFDMHEADPMQEATPAEDKNALFGIRRR